MNRQQEIFWELIEVFNDFGLLKEIMVIGSWAEYIYEWHYGKTHYQSNLKTMDIDLFYRNINRPNKKIPLIDQLKKRDYLATQTMQGITKVIKENMEIDFLVRQMGAGQMEPYLIKPINVRAEGLRGLELLNKYPLIVNANGYEITAPTPQTYVLHKLLLNPQRGPKQEKDMEGIKSLIRQIKQTNSDRLLLGSVYDDLSKKEKNMVQEVCTQNDIDLPELFHTLSS